MGWAFWKLCQVGREVSRTLRATLSFFSRKLGCLLKIPVLKFLLHSASYLWFLIFLLGESLVMETQLSTFRGRSQSVWETSLHMVWVTGTCVGPFIRGSPLEGSSSLFFIISTPVGSACTFRCPLNI